jgi:hypothetical protein
VATKYFQSNNIYKIAKDTSFTMLDDLPVANYTVKYTQVDGFFLEQTESFVQLPKVYGSSLQNADRILNTFMDRPASTGTLLVGEKGSGKTLLAREISIKAAEKGIPTIIINSAYSGEAFMEFLAAITQPTIILFDEFEKMYNPRKNDGQESILTLLDGVFQSRKLFLMTCNDKLAIDQYMINRPGRLFYIMEFSGLSSDFVLDYLNDVLNDKSQIENVVRIIDIFKTFNFDMLKALVEEMNRYNETPRQALEFLNINPSKDYATYAVELTTREGYVLKGGDEIAPKVIKNPLTTSESFMFTLYYPTLPRELLGNEEAQRQWEEGEFDDKRIQYPTFVNLDIVKCEGSVMILKNEMGDVLKLTRQEEKIYDWRGF